MLHLEGRGRIPAYIPKMVIQKSLCIFNMHPLGGANAQGSYGMFSVPPDAGVTILVFFADNGEITEGYWFAVAQEVPSITGGASGTAKADGTGQGEGAFKDVPLLKLDQLRCVRQFLQPEDEQENANKNAKNTASQGIYSDNLRGQTTASPHRDANYETTQHSKVYGWSTIRWETIFLWTMVQ